MSRPSSPIVGQYYPTVVGPGEPQWIYDGVAWNIVQNVGQAVSVFVSGGTWVYDILALPTPFGNPPTSGFVLLTHL